MSAQSEYESAKAKYEAASAVLLAEQALRRANAGFPYVPPPHAAYNKGEREVIPHDILTTLFRGLVWGGQQMTKEQHAMAWGWLEQHNFYEEMGQ